MADDWDQWVDKLVGGLPDAEDEEAPVPSPVVHPVKPQSPPQRGDSPEVFSGSGAMVDAHEEWMKEQANSLESSVPRPLTPKPKPRPSPMPVTQKNAPPPLQVGKDPSWESSVWEPDDFDVSKWNTLPFFFTEAAALAGQAASVVSACVMILSYFAAHANVEYLPDGRPSTALPDLGISVGMLASCIVGFALCGGIRCLVVLARQVMRRNPVTEKFQK